MNNLSLLRRNGIPPTPTMNVRRILLALGLAATVWAWPAPVRAAEASAKSNAQAIPDTVNPGSAVQTTNYVLRPTDVIDVNVIDDPKASGEFTISATGTVSLTYLDPEKPLKLQGLTVNEATRLIASEYVKQEIFVKPTINVTVKSYAERRINVLGQVNSPGTVDIPPEQNLSLVSAITQAHGPTSRASRYVWITRKMPDGTTKTFKDVDLLAAMKGTGPDFPLQEGDTITVFESLIGTDFQ